MKTKVFYLIFLIGLAIACWWSWVHFFGSQFPSTIVFLIVICLFAPALIWAARRVDLKIWICIGLVILIVLCLPDWLVVNLFLVPLSQPRDGLVEFTLLMTFCAAVVVAALLFQSGLNLLNRQNASIEQEGDSPAHRKPSRWIAVIALVLGALVLAQALHFFYWFMVWDTTGDGLGGLWLAIPILAVLFSCVLLLNALLGKTKLASFLYLLLIPVLMTISACAQSVDFRQLTEERAGQVNQAIETFYAREGRYPHALGQLIPWYAISLPNPLIIYAQDWCYDGGDDHYRLGYVNRDHWSDPNLYGRIYKSNGKIPDLPSLCAEEIAALKNR